MGWRFSWNWPSKQSSGRLVPTRNSRLPGWFWEFLDNVGLAEFSDEDWLITYEEAGKRLHDAVTGKTSFFLASRAKDPLWDQLGGYILSRTDLV